MLRFTSDTGRKLVLRLWQRGQRDWHVLRPSQRHGPPTAGRSDDADVERHQPRPNIKSLAGGAIDLWNGGTTRASEGACSSRRGEQTGRAAAQLTETPRATDRNALCDLGQVYEIVWSNPAGCVEGPSPSLKYRCVDNACVGVSSGPGFPTNETCQQGCGPVPVSAATAQKGVGRADAGRSLSARSVRARSRARAARRRSRAGATPASSARASTTARSRRLDARAAITRPSATVAAGPSKSCLQVSVHPHEVKAVCTSVKAAARH